MNAARTDFITLEVKLPTRWAVGESRLVNLRLCNHSGIDLSRVKLRTTWTGSEKLDELWREVGNLRRLTNEIFPLQVMAPPGREDQFQVEIRAEVGNFLHLELRSEKVDVEARPRPVIGGGPNVDLSGSSIQGDKTGMGQIVQEGGSGVGHVFNFHGGSAEQNFEAWLADDSAAGTFCALPLYIASEICLDWTSHCGIPLMGLAAGEFWMGASPGDPQVEPDEKVRREVIISRAFWMAKHPVTMAQYAQVIGDPPPVEHAAHRGDRMPAACVSWGDAMLFCEQLTCMEQAAGDLPPGYAYRLPTEAQWEYACRAGTDTAHYGDLVKIGSVKKNCGGMREVGQFMPNAWGVYDMLGLVFEWCLDAYGPYKRFELTDPFRRDPEPGQPLHRVLRGGCYQGPDEFARASARLSQDPAKTSHRIGFRVVLVRE